MILLDPNHHNRTYPDERSREIMLKTIAFFEGRGKAKLKEDDHNRTPEFRESARRLMQMRRQRQTMMHGLSRRATTTATSPAAPSTRPTAYRSARDSSRWPTTLWMIRNFPLN